VRAGRKWRAMGAEWSLERAAKGAAWLEAVDPKHRSDELLFISLRLHPNIIDDHFLIPDHPAHSVARIEVWKLVNAERANRGFPALPYPKRGDGAAGGIAELEFRAKERRAALGISPVVPTAPQPQIVEEAKEAKEPGVSDAAVPDAVAHVRRKDD